jgi:D-erythronate 2-dehydrogenase
MSALITGAAGFVGRRLVTRLFGAPESLPGLNELVLLDLKSSSEGKGGTAIPTRWVEGSLSDGRVLAAAIPDDLQYVFHLASVPGGAAEAEFDAGMRANLDGTRMLLDALRFLSAPPVFVFASTVGVFGVPMPEVIDDETYPVPTMAYGAQKLIGEILLCDYSRRGWIDGRAVRLPGIVARPPAPTGQLSAFLSDLLRELTAGREFVCPVAPEGKSWWMSVECCVDNLLHAARMSVEPSLVRRVWTLPVLHASLGEIVAAIARTHGPSVWQRVRFEPNEKLQAQFASLPPIRSSSSLAAGFRHDGDLNLMIQRALREA